MTDVITFDVELTENQKIAQHKLYQVHKLYDEIEKLLGTQDVFIKPHMLLVLPNKLKKEQMTNEEWIKSLDTEQLAEWIASVVKKAISIKENNDIVMLESAVWWDEWLKQPHREENEK